MIEVKASIKNGDRLKAYSAWNKEMPVAVKGVGKDRDSFQLPPSVRVVIPTYTEFSKDENAVSKVYANPEAALKKGLTLTCGVQVITEDGVVNLIVENVSESLVTISDGEVLAYLE